MFCVWNSPYFSRKFLLAYEPGTITMLFFKIGKNIVFILLLYLFQEVNTDFDEFSTFSLLKICFNNFSKFAF
jgi:hypothetical protein